MSRARPAEPRLRTSRAPTQTEGGLSVKSPNMSRSAESDPSLSDRLQLSPISSKAWIDKTDLDGFNLAFVVRPETFVDVVNWVVPELQRRGRYRTSYPDGTLREKLFGHPRLDKRHPAARHRWF